MTAVKWRYRTPARNGPLRKNVRFGGSDLAAGETDSCHVVLTPMPGPRGSPGPAASLALAMLLQCR
jgi:hypothetical protein